MLFTIVLGIVALSLQYIINQQKSPLLNYIRILLYIGVLIMVWFDSDAAATLTPKIVLTVLFLRGFYRDLIALKKIRVINNSNRIET